MTDQEKLDATFKTVDWNNINMSHYECSYGLDDIVNNLQLDTWYEFTIKRLYNNSQWYSCIVEMNLESIAKKVFWGKYEFVDKTLTWLTPWEAIDNSCTIEKADCVNGTKQKTIDYINKIRLETDTDDIKNDIEHEVCKLCKSYDEADYQEALYTTVWGMFCEVNNIRIDKDYYDLDYKTWEIWNTNDDFIWYTQITDNLHEDLYIKFDVEEHTKEIIEDGVKVEESLFYTIK